MPKTDTPKRRAAEDWQRYLSFEPTLEPGSQMPKRLPLPNRLGGGFSGSPVVQPGTGPAWRPGMLAKKALQYQAPTAILPYPTQEAILPRRAKLPPPPKRPRAK